MAVSSSTVLRVRGLPPNRNIDQVTSLLEHSLDIGAEASGLKITSLAEDPYHAKKQVATLMFLKEPPPLFFTSNTNQWSINVAEVNHSLASDRDQTLSFDTHFRGLTALNTPVSKEEAVDCVVVCGLGGHALGSFKEKGTSYMWLRDSLPGDLPNLRTLLYGYESGLDESDSNQNVSIIADSFVGHLSQLRSQSKTIPAPLLIIAHSLGGLVVKQAIIKLGRGSEHDKKQMESVVGMLFFGVPNRGMDIESLQAIVCDRQNRYLLESVGQYSDLLLEQDGQFGPIFHFKDSPIVSFYETKSSPTAIEVNGSWKMAGPKKILVNRFSATHPRLWESDHEGFNRTHSDLVKFSRHDVDYERVLYRLREISSKGTATLTSRYLSQESPSVMSPDEEACLRSLSFAEIYARESIIEPAVQDTGRWLLERQNLQDWIERKKMDEHRGFFWIQGNPGSGKSTLMKKVYLHVTACPQDPSSVVAAFFFNARGSEIEKSPTGLFRTLLHTLCQRISALRDRVVKAFVAKQRLLNHDWQWQLNELKEFLAAAVTSPVIGQRNLQLFVDALDECDFAATQTVIHMFEDLASSSLSEGTRFSICLSSRYWPQFRIRNCFNARVELENQGDIVAYIQKRLEPTQIDEDLSVHAALKSEILDKAKGTFLWVVLVVRELLHASNAGAPLRELRDVVQRVPQDLREFYQHQLRCTKGGDRERMLRLLQLVFYAQRPLSPTELRYALAFGCGTYASYAEWLQSSEYIRNDEQMERRIRELSRGLVEVTPLPKENESAQSSAPFKKAVVQFIHQSVRDFLTADGFSFLRESRSRTHDGDGHEFMKLASLNYLRIKDLEVMSVVDLRVSEQFDIEFQASDLSNDHPLLEYAVQYIFPQAAQAELNGVSQDGFRNHICSNLQGFFKRWRYFYDLLVPIFPKQGPEARPIHILAQYGLLTREVAEKEKNIDIEGGTYSSALVAACWDGHQNAVQILLELGADPKFDASRHLKSGTWSKKMAPLVCAVYNQDLLVLSRLVNNPRSFLTLQERLQLVTSIEDEEPQLKAILALLFPEATFPKSATHDLCEAAGRSLPGAFLFLLDKCEESIVYEEKLWLSVIQGSRHENVSKTRVLLDRGGTVKITDALFKGIFFDELGTSLPLLLEKCEAEMTEDLIDIISQSRDSQQLVRTFEAAGYRIGSFTPRQLLRTLRRGSAETAAFFLQRQDGKASADGMLKAALSNRFHGVEVTRLLLGHLNPDHINEEAIFAALGNFDCGCDLIILLHSRWSSLTFSEAALAVAVRCQPIETVKFVLERCECARVTEEILTAAASTYYIARAPKIIDLLLLHDPGIRVQEFTVIAAIQRPYQVLKILDTFCRHGKSLFCTENIVAAAAMSDIGPKALEIILKQDRGARISSSMIMMAMQAERGAALISVLLNHDQSLIITEEHLIAAASNRDDPSLIFAFLQTKGKLRNPDIHCEVLSTGPAKRLRVSRISSPRISPGVIKTALSNPKKGARRLLLELFVEWGVITELDLNDAMDNFGTRS